MNPGLAVLLMFVVGVVGVAAGIFYQERVRGANQKMQAQLNYEERLRQLKEEGERRLLDLQTQQRDAQREAKEETVRIRTALETENRERRQEVKKQEQRLQIKEETLDRKTEALDKRDRLFTERDQEMAAQKEQLERLREERLAELERVGKMTAEEARQAVIAEVTERAQRDAARQAREIEARARRG